MRSLQGEVTRFPNGNRARVLQVSRYAPIGEVVEALHVPPPRAVLICNGGTGAMEPGLEAAEPAGLCHQLAADYRAAA